MSYHLTLPDIKTNLKNQKMKKLILLAFIFIFALGASTVFAADPKSDPAKDKLTAPDKKENKLSEEEMSLLTKRVEEIRDMDKTNMTVKEKRELKKELKGIKEDVRKRGGVVYIGAGSLILLIILVILLV
jgi:hypothetical protein